MPASILAIALALAVGLGGERDAGLPRLDRHYDQTVPEPPWATWATAPDALRVRHDVIIVLGCPSRPDGAASACQRRRVRRALRLADAGYADRFIVTGGAVHNDHVEAEGMRDLLVAAGVDAGQVWVEPTARHTDENIRASTSIMREQGWTRALVVSDPAHLLYVAVCDANCHVGDGRLVTYAWPVGDGSEKAATWVLAPEGRPATATECRVLADPSRAMCLARR